MLQIVMNNDLARFDVPAKSATNLPNLLPAFSENSALQHYCRPGKFSAELQCKRSVSPRQVIS